MIMSFLTQELVKTQKTSASQVTGDMEKLKSELANKATEASSLQQKVQTLEASLAVSTTEMQVFF